MKSIFYIVILCVAVILLSLQACLNKPETYSDFLIKVDSIHCPDSVVANAPFEIEFFGTIGFDACTSFKTFNQKTDNKDIIIEAWGTFENSGNCPEVLVTLNGRKLQKTILIPGKYLIKVLQPDNSLIYKNIKVKEAL